MCGIDGVIVGRRVMPREAVAGRLDLAEAAQAHRGPDGAGRLVEGVGDWWVGLGHQRLAIIDLSDRAAQPMTGPDGLDVIVYNGEVYDYAALRRRLVAEGVTFASDSDTEVVAAALREWGVERALNAFNGMWALAWLDARGARLQWTAARDGSSAPEWVKARARQLLEENVGVASADPTATSSTMPVTNVTSTQPEFAPPPTLAAGQRSPTLRPGETPRFPPPRPGQP